LIHKFLKDERGQLDILVLLLDLLVIVAVVLLAVIIVALLLFALIALFLYIWRIIFPFFRSITEWLMNPVNGAPFFLFMLILITITGALLDLWIFLFYLTSHWAFLLLALLVVPLLSLALLINGVALGLAIMAVLVRLNQHTFHRFQTRFLTTAFRIVMWRAKRKQPREQRPKPRAKRRRLGLKRRQKAEEEPQEAVDRPKPNAKRRKLSLTRRKKKPPSNDIE